MPDNGDAHQAENRIVEVKRLRGPAEVTRALDMKAGDSVVYIKRVQSFESAPIILEEIWLPGALFKGLTAERLAEYKGPMYGLFETEFGTQMIHATEKLKAALADDAIAATLGVASGTPVLSVERVAFTYGERPVELRRAIYITAQHHYHNELS
jgi:GntR family transcriptional regulator